MKIFKSYYMSASIVPDKLELDDTVSERSKYQVIVNNYTYNHFKIMSTKNEANFIKR